MFAYILHIRALLDKPLTLLFTAHVLECPNHMMKIFAHYTSVRSQIDKMGPWTRRIISPTHIRFLVIWLRFRTKKKVSCLTPTDQRFCCFRKSESLFSQTPQKRIQRSPRWWTDHACVVVPTRACLAQVLNSASRVVHLAFPTSQAGRPKEKRSGKRIKTGGAHGPQPARCRGDRSRVPAKSKLPSPNVQQIDAG